MADSIVLFFVFLKGFDDSFVGETFNSFPSSYFKKALIVYSGGFFLDVFFSNGSNSVSTAQLQIDLPRTSDSEV